MSNSQPGGRKQQKSERPATVNPGFKSALAREPNFSSPIYLDDYATQINDGTFGYAIGRKLEAEKDFYNIYYKNLISEKNATDTAQDQSVLSRVQQSIYDLYKLQAIYTTWLKRNDSAVMKLATTTPSSAKWIEDDFVRLVTNKLLEEKIMPNKFMFADNEVFEAEFEKIAKQPWYAHLKNGMKAEDDKEGERSKNAKFYTFIDFLRSMVAAVALYARGSDETAKSLKKDCWDYSALSAMPFKRMGPVECDLRLNNTWIEMKDNSHRPRDGAGNIKPESDDALLQAACYWARDRDTTRDNDKSYFCHLVSVHFHTTQEPEIALARVRFTGEESQRLVIETHDGDVTVDDLARHFLWDAFTRI